VFKKIGPNTVNCSEGYTVELVGRNELEYREAEGRAIRFYVESWAPRADILLDTTSPMNASGHLLNSLELTKKETAKAVGRIIVALKFMGLEVHLKETPSSSIAKYSVRHQIDGIIEYREGDYVFRCRSEVTPLSKTLRVKLQRARASWDPPHDHEAITEAKLQEIAKRVQSSLRAKTVIE